MEGEDVLSSSCSSQELQNSTLDESPEVVYTPPEENSPVEVLHPLIEVRPVEVRVHRLDLALLNSTVNLTDEDEASGQDAVQDAAPMEYVEGYPSFNFDISGRFEYLVADADGNPHVPATLIPASFTSRIHYGACGRCSRAKEFGYQDWLDLKYSCDPEDLDSIGDLFCTWCELDCNTQELFDQHVESVHVRLGWFPLLEECSNCLHPSYFPSPLSD